MGREALGFGESGERAEDDRAGRARSGDRVDEDDVPAVGPGDGVDEVLGDILGVEQGDLRPGQGRPRGADDPRTDPVIAAERIADADEARRLPQPLGKGGAGAEGVETGVPRRGTLRAWGNGVLPDAFERDIYNNARGVYRDVPRRSLWDLSVRSREKMAARPGARDELPGRPPIPLNTPHILRV